MYGYNGGSIRYYIGLVYMEGKPWANPLGLPVEMEGSPATFMQ